MRRWLLRLALAGCAVVVATVVVSNCVIVGRASGLVYDEPAEVPARPWAIVLGAAVYRRRWPSPTLVARLEAARAVYAAGKVGRIFVSGDRDNGEDGVMTGWLVAHGVPADRITADGAGFRTRATMENARAAGITEAIVCTQAFHLDRSIAWGRAVGIDAVGVVAGHDDRPGERLREVLARTLAAFEIAAS